MRSPLGAKCALLRNRRSLVRSPLKQESAAQRESTHRCNRPGRRATDRQGGKKHHVMRFPIYAYVTLSKQRALFWHSPHQLSSKGSKKGNTCLSAEERYYIHRCDIVCGTCMLACAKKLCARKQLELHCSLPFETQENQLHTKTSAINETLCACLTEMSAMHRKGST